MVYLIQINLVSKAYTDKSANTTLKSQNIKGTFKDKKKKRRYWVNYNYEKCAYMGEENMLSVAQLRSVFKKKRVLKCTKVSSSLWRFCRVFDR